MSDQSHCTKTKQDLWVMKWFSTLLCLLLLGIQTFGQGLILCQFLANRSRIAATLCVNRDRPFTHCQGKCQLVKKMNASEPGSPADQNPRPKTEEVFFELIASASLPFFRQPASLRCGMAQPFLPTASQAVIFRPPITTATFPLLYIL